jgi:peptidoglycan/LPS O-acetylase OafA/YrhL
MQGLVALAADGRWVNLADRHDLSIAFLACVATVCLARISAVWLERPLLSLGHRVQFNKAGTVPQAA